MSDAAASHRGQAADDARSRNVGCAVLTVSDSRTLESDASGQLILERLEQAGHRALARRLVPDDAELIGAMLESWCVDPEIELVISTGGTGIARRDRTIEIVRGLLTKELEGFGELFRVISHREIGAAAMLSRAAAGLVCRAGCDTFLFALPGSVNAVQTAMDGLILPEISHLLWLRREEPGREASSDPGGQRGLATGLGAIAHGVDLVEIGRVESLLETHGSRFTHRCFTDAEQAYADGGRRLRAERYAVRFACKEAVMKALGTGWSDGIRWKDIGVVRGPRGRPELELSGRAGALAAELGIERWLVSLSHSAAAARGRTRPEGKLDISGGYALASVVGLCGRGAGLAREAAIA